LYVTEISVNKTYLTEFKGSTNQKLNVVSQDKVYETAIMSFTANQPKEVCALDTYMGIQNSKYYFIQTFK